MRRTLAGTVAACAVAGVLLEAEQVFRAGTDFVLLTVTATDGQGHAARSLGKGDFTVFEDGVAQDVSVFAADPQPISLSILIDASASMERKMPVAHEAAIGFCHRLGPHDVAQIVSFNSTVAVLQPFTREEALLDGAIRRVRADGSTALYTAVYISLTELNHVRAASPDAMRRQAIILLSDGEDSTSLLHDDDVLELAKRSAVAVYTIGLREKRDKNGPPLESGQSDYVLRALAQSTGGRVFFVDDPMQLPAIYGQIADELGGQYTLGYVSKNLKRDAAWRQVAVQVSQAGITARTRTGYYAAKQRPQ